MAVSGNDDEASSEVGVINKSPEAPVLRTLDDLQWNRNRALNAVSDLRAWNLVAHLRVGEECLVAEVGRLNPHGKDLVTILAERVDGVIEVPRELSRNRPIRLQLEELNIGGCFKRTRVIQIGIVHCYRHVLECCTISGIGEYTTDVFSDSGRSTQNLKVLVSVSILGVLRLLIVLHVQEIDYDVPCLVLHRQKEELSTVWVDYGLLVTAGCVFIRVHRTYRLQDRVRVECEMTHNC